MPRTNMRYIVPGLCTGHVSCGRVLTYSSCSLSCHLKGVRFCKPSLYSTTLTIDLACPGTPTRLTTLPLRCARAWCVRVRVCAVALPLVRVHECVRVYFRVRGMRAALNATAVSHVRDESVQVSIDVSEALIPPPPRLTHVHSTWSILTIIPCPNSASFMVHMWAIESGVGTRSNGGGRHPADCYGSDGGSHRWCVEGYAVHVTVI
jgi:hypothetical protein